MTSITRPPQLAFTLLAMAARLHAATPVTATVTNTWYSYVDGVLVSQLTTTVGTFARNGKGDEVTMTPTSVVVKRGGRAYSVLPTNRQFIPIAPGYSSTILQSTKVLRQLFAPNPGAGETINGLECVPIPVHATSNGLQGVGKMWVSPRYELQVKIDTEWTAKGQKVGRDVMEMTDIRIGTEPEPDLFSAGKNNKESK